MAKVVLFNKPYDVLSQFTDGDGRNTLADYISDPALKKVYPAGRLDRDSEGLVVLTDNGTLQHQIAHPDHKAGKTYWVQVEGDITDEALNQLRHGLELKDGLTQPAIAHRMDEPDLWQRSKPVRFRANIPTSWLTLTLREGRNRQVRRMTAAAGFPTLRLIRFSVGDWNLLVADDDPAMMQPGEYRVLNVTAPSPKPRRNSTATKPKQHKSNKNTKSGARISRSKSTRV